MGIAEALAKFDTSGVVQSSSLSTGADVTNLSAVEGRTRKVMEGSAKLRATYSGKDAVTAAKDWGKAEARLLAMQQTSKAILGKVGAQVGMLRTATAHSKSMQGYEQQVQEILAQHGMNVMSHNLNTQTTQAHYGGYRQGMTGSAWDSLT